MMNRSPIHPAWILRRWRRNMVDGYALDRVGVRGCDKRYLTSGQRIAKSSIRFDTDKHTMKGKDQDVI